MKKKPLDIKDQEAAERLRNIWDEKKVTLRLTQEKAADALGFETQSTVSQYLNGRNPLNTDAILKFAALLGVKPEDIKPDLKEMMNYVRKSGTHSEDIAAPGWQILKPEHAELVSLYERLPESEKIRHMSDLKEKVADFDRLFKELLAARKQ
ncbi:helix-turn-helix domain-containing protein [Serratia sp. JSRIV002]|jgi:transcriptional regulator with XRE-family HTH domain|uniref:helix-turn-helix domain-containing protein n=1 Tax=Serratia sp. JSRIV002 TaxID=2831894 RepID=UPI001CBDD5D0|nr:helix-turn-helix domain-containing protein [Serratia sp. JSRIV002]UAN53444.1 helix-turn-helix domain-containing protein [Serratia sp. JSRIV002]